MKRYWIDFSAYCEIEAESAEQAMEKFWESRQTENGEVYSLDGIEEQEI